MTSLTLSLEPPPLTAVDNYEILKVRAIVHAAAAAGRLTARVL